jgi:antibiotic biosynthesis monooxygenase (ABM) superfamily enzyme
VVLVALMTYVLMPLLTRFFARWLYPPSERAETIDSE